MAKMERVGGDEKHLEDVILLNQYIRNNGLSRAKSDALLKMCAKICSNHGWKWPMYKSAKALHTVCEKHMMKFHSRKKQSWRIPKVFIGDMGVLEDRTRSKTRGAARNIMQKVAYELVFQSPDNFAANLPNPKLRDGQQIISDWSTSHLFSNGTRVVQKLFGEDAVFMGLAISIDGTMSNSRAVEICPVSVSILNLIGDGSEKLFHVAYFPLVVHQSNTELRQLLEAREVGTVKAKDELIKIITKKLGFDFMYNILKEGSGWMFSEGTVNLEDARPYRMQVGSISPSPSDPGPSSLPVDDHDYAMFIATSLGAAFGDAPRNLSSTSDKLQSAQTYFCLNVSVTSQARFVYLTIHI